MLNQVVLVGHLVVVRAHNVQIMVEQNNVRQFIDVYMTQEMLDVCEGIIMNEKLSKIIAVKGTIESYEGNIRIVADRISAHKGDK